MGAGWETTRDVDVADIRGGGRRRLVVRCRFGGGAPDAEDVLGAAIDEALRGVMDSIVGRFGVEVEELAARPDTLAEHAAELVLLAARRAGADFDRFEILGIDVQPRG